MTYKISILVVFVIFFAACSNETESVRSKLEIDGSSTVYPITLEANKSFIETGENANLDLNVSGTSLGLFKFCDGQISVANASRMITANEAAVCEENNIDFLEIPIAIDGIAVVVNEANDWVDYLTVSELKTIWQAESERRVTRWKQVRSTWPDEEIKLFGPSTASGTHSYFAEQIVGEGKTTRGDYAATEDDEVLVRGITDSFYGLGMFGLAYYQENFYRLKLVPVDDGNDSNGEGGITPSLESIKNGTYQPLSRTLYLYVATSTLTENRTRRFLTYFLENAPEFVQKVGYIPQPRESYKSYINQINQIGTSD